MPSEPSPPHAEDLLRHGAFLRSLARGLLGDEAGAEDVVQEVWIRALERPPDAGVGLRGWLARVTRNLALDRRRGEEARRRREAAYGGGGEAPRTGGASEVVDQLGAALAGLPANYREALHLRYYEGLAPPEVARRLGVSAETARTRLRRGLELLRRDVGRRRGVDEAGLGAVLVPLLSTGGRDLASTGPCGSLGTVLVMKKMTVVVATLVLIVSGVAYRVVESGDPPGSAIPSGDGALVASGPGSPEPTPAGSLVPARRAEVGEASDRRRLETTATAPGLELALRYATTGEALPFYRFRFELDGQWLDLASDGYGRVQLGARTTRRLRGAGKPLKLRLPGVLVRREAPSQVIVNALRTGVISSISLEEPDPSPQASPEPRPLPTLPEATEEFPLPDPGEPRAVPVDLGPSYLLELDLPPGYVAGDFEVSLREAASSRLVGWRVALEAPAPDWPAHVVHLPAIESQEECELQVRSRDGRLRWSRPVETDARLHDGLLSVSFVGCAVLEGTVSGDGTTPSLRSVRLQSRDGEVEHRADCRGSDRAFRFPWVPPGEYTLLVDDPHHVPYREALDLAAGQVARRDPVLQPRASGGAVVGRIRSRTGTYRRAGALYLNGVGDQDTWRRHAVIFEESEEGFVAPFEFLDLGAGDYRLTLTLSDYAVTGPSRVSPPRGDLEFLVEDDRPLLPFVPFVVDAATGARIESFTLGYGPPGSLIHDRRSSPSEPLELELAEGLEFGWRVQAVGYRGSTGTVEDFGGEPLRVALEPGFGVRVHALSIHSFRNLEGVEIFADGVPVGRTDAGGDLFVDLPERPQRLGVDPERWRIHADETYRSRIDPETGAFDEERHGLRLTVYLRPVAGSGTDQGSSGK